MQQFAGWLNLPGNQLSQIRHLKTVTKPPSPNTHSGAWLAPNQKSFLLTRPSHGSCSSLFNSGSLDSSCHFWGSWAWTNTKRSSKGRLNAWPTFHQLTSQLDHLSAHPLTCSLHSYCWQASQIAFQLTSWLAAYILTADKPVGSPFSSPLGFQLTENNTGWLEVYLKTADKSLSLPFSSPLGLQLALYGCQLTFKLPLLGQLDLPGNRV